MCCWFPFPTVVTVVHHVNWCLWGVVLTGYYFHLSVHISVASCFSGMVRVDVLESYIVPRITNKNEASFVRLIKICH